MYSWAGCIYRLQTQYFSRYVAGWEDEGYPNLGVGLSLENPTGDEFDMAIAPSDAGELVSRLKMYLSLQYNRTSEEETRKPRALTAEETELCQQYLRERKLPIPE